MISGDLSNDQCTGKSITVGNDGMAFISLSNAEDDGVVAFHIEVSVAADRSFSFPSFHVTFVFTGLVPRNPSLLVDWSLQSSAVSDVTTTKKENCVILYFTELLLPHDNLADAVNVNG